MLTSVETERMGKLVMVVDDSATMRQMESLYLKAMGFEVLACVSGEEAIGRFVPQLSLIISDINMPGMNGIEFIKKIRTMEGGRSIPVVIISTEVTEQLKQEARAAGSSAWIVKPFKKEDLELVLSRIGLLA